MTSPSKPQLITILPRTPTSKTESHQPATPFECQPALVSAFSPDTPPETPHVANRSQVNDIATCPSVNEQELGGLDRKINYPITPPNSRVPTPFDRITSLACRRKHSRAVQPTMTPLDPSTAWVLQELETLLADFPMTALRLNSPVVRMIRLPSSHFHIAEKPARYRSCTAPHSWYSPYKQLMNQYVGEHNPPQGARAPPPSRASQNIHADPTALALQTVFPNARPHHLDSLYATYLALHYIVTFPPSEFTAASRSDSTASPYTTPTKHSRSSSIVSNVPPKARAMLGLESPIQPSPSVPSPARSWFRASTPELDPELNMRLENIKLLLETSIRKILVEMEGRSIGKQDDALIRAVGEIIKMGEKRVGASIG